MDDEFINITTENVFNEHLCCIIRSKKFHPGIDAKRQWLSKRLNEGHVFRKLNERGTVFIEYAPLEKAWVPIVGDNYFYIYCLWVMGSYKGKGYGKSLMDYCLADAKAKGKSGVCLLGSKKQKAKKQKIENKELTIYYDMQCPFVYQSLEIVKQYCEINNVPILMIQVDTLQKAKDLPCVFNNWAVFYHGKFETVNLLDKNTLTRLLKK